MTTPTLSHIVDTFHSLYPPHLAASWDSSGLVCGRLQTRVKHVHFAVDAISATAQEAVNLGVGLLITHHPLLLRGTSFIPDSDYKGNVLHTLIEGGCGLLGAHTNADAAVAGVNEALCEALNLQGCEPLTDQQQQELAGEEYCVGTGRVGALARPLTLQELSEELAAALPATAGGLRVAGSPQNLFAVLPSAEAPVTRCLMPCGHLKPMSISPQIYGITPPASSGNKNLCEVLILHSSTVRMLQVNLYG